MEETTFNDLWDNLISVVICDYQNRFANIIVPNNAKEAIYTRYKYLNQECKQRYMENPEGKLDRHKVCACLMYAILQADVLKCELAEVDVDEKYLVLNEHLALTVGMSLLRAFIITDIKKSAFPDDEKQRLIGLVDNGIKYPNCNHGEYQKNFASELYYTKRFYNYNILSLAHILFLLEIYTLGVDVICK